MVQPVPRNEGFTLVEMMISIVIIMISMLALVTMMTKAINTNMTNEMRTASVRLTNQTAEALLSIPTTSTTVDPLVTAGSYARIANDSHQDSMGLPKIQQTIRGTSKTFTINWKVTDTTPTIKQIEIGVSYILYSNQTFTNSMVVYKHSTGM
jgi:Tfp pilus assembly protein PilV